MKGWEERSKIAFDEIMKSANTIMDHCYISVRNGSCRNLFPFMLGSETPLNNTISESSPISLDEEDLNILAKCAISHTATGNDIVYAKANQSPWSDIESKMLPALNALIREGEEVGAVSDFGSTLISCRSILHLIVSMKSKLEKCDWGDNTW